MGISQEQIKELLSDREQITVFEVGCADGVDTKKFLNTFGSNFRIYTFDPEPINVEFMTTFGSKDAAGNSNDILVTDDRHKFYPYAFSNENGKSIFYRSRNNDGPDNGYNWGRYSGSIRKPITIIESPKYGRRWPACSFDEQVEVETKRLDTFCEESEINHIDFLWMDTQGAEKDVLTGAGEMLKNIDYVYTEYYDEEMYEGCIGLDQIKILLPGFELVSDWRYNDADGGDVLFKRV